MPDVVAELVSGEGDRARRYTEFRTIVPKWKDKPLPPRQPKLRATAPLKVNDSFLLPEIDWIGEVKIANYADNLGQPRVDPMTSRLDFVAAGKQCGDYTLRRASRLSRLRFRKWRDPLWHFYFSRLSRRDANGRFDLLVKRSYLANLLSFPLRGGREGEGRGRPA